MSTQLLSIANVIAVACYAITPEGQPPEIFYPLVAHVIGEDGLGTSWPIVYREAAARAQFVSLSNEALRSWAACMAEEVTDKVNRSVVFSLGMWGVMIAYHSIPSEACTVLTHLQIAFGLNDGLVNVIQSRYPLGDLG